MNEDEVTVVCWVMVIGIGEGYAFDLLWAHTILQAAAIYGRHC